MDREKLIVRIEKKEKEIERLRAKCAKCEAALGSDEYIGIARGYEAEVGSAERDAANARRKAFCATPDGKRLDWEMYYACNAYSDLGDAERTLAKYREKLKSSDDFRESAKVPAIWDFVNKWMEEFRDYVLSESEKYFRKEAEFPEACEAFLQSKADEAEAKYGGFESHKYNFLVCAINDFRRSYLRGIEPMALAFTSFPKFAKANVSAAGVSLQVRRATLCKVDTDGLGRKLAEERDAKYSDFIRRVEKVAGSIVDASGLRIGEKGNVCGIVKGSIRNAYVDTIPCAGYHIVRFHYRVIVEAPKSLNSEGAL